jgi:uncharacterized membrane protein YfcA
LLLAAIAFVVLYGAVEVARYRRPSETRELGRRELLLNAAAIGFGVGVIGGIVGLILGSLRVPALLKIVGERPARVAGTNLAVGFWVGVFGAIGHLPSDPPDWKLAGLGAAASIPGALIGARLTGRLSEIQLVRAIAGVLLVAGIATGAQAVS